MRILILDPNGLVGKAVSNHFKNKGHFVNDYELSLFDFDSLGKEIKENEYDAVINCSAIVNRHADEDKTGAVLINSYLPHFLEKVTADSKTIVVHRSTDCIFSGEKGGYSVDDIPDGESFYARTKAIGEIVNEKDITIRTSLVGKEEKNGEGLLAWFLRQKGEVNGYANAIWTGITSVEYAKEIEMLLGMNAHGLFQLVPDYPISKYDLLLLFEKYFPGDRTIIRYDNARVDKSLIPYFGNYKIIVPSYEQMIKELSNE